VQAVLPNLPRIDTPPTWSADTYGNPANAFAYIQTALLNANGIAAVVEVTGVNGHWYQGDAYYTQLSPGWSWSVPTRIFLGQTDLDGSALPYHAQSVQLGISIAGINSSNQVLGLSQPGPYSSQAGPFVYNINTQASIQLGNLDGNYLNLQPIAISDNGTLLLEGQPVAGGADQTLLLAPEGVSPNPVTVAPEPGAWAVMSLAAAGFAFRRYQSRRRGFVADRKTRLPTDYRRVPTFVRAWLGFRTYSPEPEPAEIPRPEKKSLPRDLFDSCARITIS
jgi:hypothetical protein